MFHPTKFPCTAWYVTAALNVWPTEVRGVSGYSGTYRCDSPSFLFGDELFATRDEAVLDAERRLAKAEKRHEKAAARLVRLRETVAKLKGGAA